MLTNNNSRALFNGNDLTTDFPFSFKVWDKNELLVEYTDKEGNTYTASGWSVNLTDSGGTVSYLLNGAPLPSGYKLAILRSMPFKQEVDLITGTRFDPEVVENALDKATAERQQLFEMTSRALLVPAYEDNPGDFIGKIFEAAESAKQSAILAEKNAELTNHGVLAPVSATGANTPRILADRFADVLNAKDFGAMGDGVTDDTEAVQALFVYANSLNHHTVIEFPAGTYIINDSVDFGGDITVMAYGATFKPSISTDLFSVFRSILGYTKTYPQTAQQGHGNIYWYGGVVDMNAHTLSRDIARQAFYIAHAHNVTFTDVHILNCARVHSFEIKSCDDISLHNCVFKELYKPVIDNYYPGMLQIDPGVPTGAGTDVIYYNPDGITCHNIGIYNCIFDCTVSKSFGAIDIHDPEIGFVCIGLTIKDCTFIGMDDYAVQVDKVDSCSIINSRFYNVKNAAVHIWHGKNCVVEGNVFIGAYDIIVNSDQSWSHIIMDRVSSGSVCNNYVEDRSIYIVGIDSAKSNNILVYGNRIVFKTDTIRDCAIYCLRSNNITMENNIVEAMGTVPSNFSKYRFSEGSENITVQDIRDFSLLTYTNSSTNSNIFTPKVLSPIHIQSTDVYLRPNITFEGYFRIDRVDADGLTTARSLFINAAGDIAPGEDNKTNLGAAYNRWKQVFAATTTISTSDEREKTHIDNIQPALFQAWEKVQYKQFLFKDAYSEKGDNARIHIGLIAQQVKEAFESEGLDAFRYGLLCYDAWEDEYNFITENEGDDTEIQATRELVHSAGNRYGIRYEEALALECAYLRWKLENAQS